MRRTLAFTACLLLLAACGEAVEVGTDDPSNNSAANNTAPNNAANNNTAPNNAANNNVAPNNNAGTNNNGVTTGNNSTNPNNVGGSNNNTTPPEPTACDACEGCQLLYTDADGDGFGEGEATCQPPADGLAVRGDDCAPNDPTRAPNLGGVCGDWVDDNCDGQDEACPTTQTAGVQIPDWDCTGEPPASVLAFARFDDGGGNVQDGFCFVAFEGLPGEFYAAPINLSFNRPGATCPVGYDERMYAHMVDDPETCPPLELIVHGPNEDKQQVSTDCRRFLYHMISRAPHTYLGNDADEVLLRLTQFDTVEVGCSAYEGWSQFRYSLLLTTEVELNPNFQGR